jgi:GxxExxY protein
MKPDKLIEGDLTYKIIGILYKIHNRPGPLYQEKYYQRAIEKELTSEGIKFQREYPTRIDYESSKIGEYRIDFLIDNKVVLEIKTLNRVHPKYIEQVLAYMNQLQIRVGLIANFRKDKLWIKRLLLPDKYFSSPSA